MLFPECCLCCWPLTFLILAYLLKKEIKFPIRQPDSLKLQHTANKHISTMPQNLPSVRLSNLVTWLFCTNPISCFGYYEGEAEQMFSHCLQLNSNVKVQMWFMSWCVHTIIVFTRVCQRLTHICLAFRFGSMRWTGEVLLTGKHIPTASLHYRLPLINWTLPDDLYLWSAAAVPRSDQVREKSLQLIVFVLTGSRSQRRKCFKCFMWFKRTVSNWLSNCEAGCLNVSALCFLLYLENHGSSGTSCKVWATMNHSLLKQSKQGLTFQDQIRGLLGAYFAAICSKKHRRKVSVGAVYVLTMLLLISLGTVVRKRSSHLQQSLPTMGLDQGPDALGWTTSRFQI